MRWSPKGPFPLLDALTLTGRKTFMTYWFLENTHSRSACPRLTLLCPASLAHYCLIPHPWEEWTEECKLGHLKTF